MEQSDSVGKRISNATSPYINPIHLLYILENNYLACLYNGRTSVFGLEWNFDRPSQYFDLDLICIFACVRTRRRQKSRLTINRFHSRHIWLIATTPNDHTPLCTVYKPALFASRHSFPRCLTALRRHRNPRQTRTGRVISSVVVRLACYGHNRR